MYVCHDPEVENLLGNVEFIKGSVSISPDERESCMRRLKMVHDSTILQFSLK